MSILISHRSHDNNLDRRLLTIFGDDLYLLSNLTNNLSAAKTILMRNRKVIDTETPLYGMNKSELNNYIIGANLNSDDIRSINKIAFNVVAQSMRLRIESQDFYDITNNLTSLYAYWKSTIIECKVEKYICGAIPHQVSDFILYEVACKYARKSEWVYQALCGNELRYSGSTLDGRGLKIPNYLNAQDQNLILKNNKRFEKKTKEKTSELEICSVSEWLKKKRLYDMITTNGTMSWLHFIENYMRESYRIRYMKILERAFKESHNDLPPEGSVIVLINEEPEATTFPLSSPIHGNIQLIKLVRSKFPKSQKIFVKDHPVAYRPNHRIYIKRRNYRMYKV